MGLSKTKRISLLNTSKSTFTSLNIKLGSFRAFTKIDGKGPLPSGLMNKNSAYYGNCIRNNENTGAVCLNNHLQIMHPESTKPYYEQHAFCWECGIPKYQYTFDFLYEVRDKMYEKRSTSCHCCKGLGYECYSSESESFQENQFYNDELQRSVPSYNFYRRLLYGGRQPLTYSREPSSNDHHAKRTNRHNGFVNLARNDTFPDHSDAGGYQKECNTSTDNLVNPRPKTPRTPRPFKTLHRSCDSPEEGWDKLSFSIWRSFEANKQTEDTFAKKMNVWRNLYKCIQKIPRLPKFEIFLIGSTISGFGMEGSDVDLCVVAKDGPVYCDLRTEALENLLHVKQFLERLLSNVDNIWLICAKIPILRFQQNTDKTEIEISYNNYVGIRNTQLLHSYAQLDWRVRPLVAIVKLWAKHHNLNDPRNSTISSYSLSLMVINFLQCGVSPAVLPCLHDMYPEIFSVFVGTNNSNTFERFDPFPTENNETLGCLLIKFLEYYTKFNYRNYALSVRTGTVIPLEECTWKKSTATGYISHSYLNIEEPFNRTNTGKSVHNGYIFEQIKSIFASSWRKLEQGQDLNNIFGEPLLCAPKLSVLKH